MEDPRKLAEQVRNMANHYKAFKEMEETLVEVSSIIKKLPSLRTEKADLLAEVKEQKDILLLLEGRSKTALAQIEQNKKAEVVRAGRVKAELEEHKKAHAAALLVTEEGWNAEHKKRLENVTMEIGSLLQDVKTLNQEIADLSKIKEGLQKSLAQAAA